MARIVHFDVPADDLERAKRFYTELFGWKIENVPGPMEYCFIDTSDEKGKGIAGGMGKRGAPEQRITNYIDVPSVDEYMGKVKALGGKVLQGKMAVPGFGYLAVCMDTEGNTFGLWQEEKK